MPAGLHWDVIEATFVGHAPIRHVVPVNDFKKHDLGVQVREDGKRWRPACWCKALIRDGVVTHNSMDGREKHEPDYGQEGRGEEDAEW